MKILVTGSKGMLGRVLISCLEARDHKVTGTDKDQLNITNYQQVFGTVERVEPELIVHCAAYTNVDQAESDQAEAYAVNAYGTENLAVAAAHSNIPMVYISTDYVFDGQKQTPYLPWDETKPLSVYGKSKLAGELAVQRHLNNFYIARTSWLYGPYGKNFVDTIFNLGREKKPLRVVADQWGSPTSTLSLSEIIADLIETGRYGIYHATDAGTTNWCEFAKEIVKTLNVNVEAIETKDMPRPATRPKYSSLDKTSLINTIQRDLPSWQEALANYMELKLKTEAVSKA